MRFTQPEAIQEPEVSSQPSALAELERILASDGFAKAERMRRFLTYAVNRTLSRDYDQLKESVIGVEVFDRKPSYDPKADPIVRIEARRLREKLTAYYERPGRDSLTRITLPKGGYAVAVEVLNTSPPIGATENSQATQVRLSQSFRAAWVIAFAVVIFVGAAVLWRRTETMRRLPAPLAVRAFTSLPGAESEPAFSPDGSKVAFVWTGPDGGRPNIYVQSVDRFTPTVVSPEAAGDVSSPVWSPDGREIAYLRAEGVKTSGVFTINLAARKIVRHGDVESTPRPIGPGARLDWSPDGRFFVTTNGGNLVLISTANGEKTQLTTRSEEATGHYDPAFSPDGRFVAYRQVSGVGVADLFTVDLATHAVSRLTHVGHIIDGHAWTASGKSIVFASQRSLWSVPVNGAEPERLTDGAAQALQPAISRAGKRLIFASNRSTIRTWRIALSGAGHAEQVLTSTLTDASPDISPDGMRIAFRSDRSGSDEIWIAGADGSNPRKVTSFGKPLTGCPRWSPNGKFIALDSRLHGKSDIFLVDPDTGKLSRLTTDRTDDVVPSWSRDGRFVYFASDRSGDWQIWKQSLADGTARQVTRQGGFSAWESADGRFVYYAKDRAGSGLWRVDANGGEERPVLPELAPGMWGNWRLNGNSIVFADTQPPYAIRSLDLRTMKLTRMGNLPSQPLLGDAGFALSPDGRWLYASLPDPPARDLFLVDQFN